MKKIMIMMKNFQSIRIIFMDGYKYVRTYKINKIFMAQASFCFEIYFCYISYFIYFSFQHINKAL